MANQDVREYLLQHAVTQGIPICLQHQANRCDRKEKIICDLTVLTNAYELLFFLPANTKTCRIKLAQLRQFDYICMIIGICTFDCFHSGY